MSAPPLSHTLHACLDLLDRRERLVVRAYFGLDDQEPQTLEQIGVQLGLTRERVRQIRDEASIKCEFTLVIYCSSFATIPCSKTTRSRCARRIAICDKGLD